MPRPSRRHPAQFTIPIKLWVTPEQYARLEREAKKRDWSVPQVARYCIDQVLIR